MHCLFNKSVISGDIMLLTPTFSAIGGDLHVGLGDTIKLSSKCYFSVNKQCSITERSMSCDTAHRFSLVTFDQTIYFLAS